jgi:hypothetical protein
MGDGPRTVEVPKARANSYLEKAVGFLSSAQGALERGEDTSAGALLANSTWT